jgi:hypothetical protein
MCTKLYVLQDPTGSSGAEKTPAELVIWLFSCLDSYC